jgi:hypothetical protein
MQCKSHQAVVELVLAGYLSDIDVLHPIIENLFGLLFTPLSWRLREEYLRGIVTDDIRMGR